MTPNPFEIEFRAVVATPPAEVRRRLIASVVGEASAGDDTLEILDRGPDRYASRFRSGPMEQLRVAEWSGADRARGIVEHSLSGRIRLTARYDVRLNPQERRTAVTATYTLTTPFRGLAFSFRLARRRALVRRLVGSWLPLRDARDWGEIEIVRSGPVRASGRASPPPA